MKLKTIKSFIFAFLALLSPLYGDIVLPDIISSHMVLQRHEPVRIFGTASPSEAVTVSFGGQTHNTQADAQGDWHVFLDAMNANATGRQMTISGQNTIVLDDILVGEVWIGSGQSNMDWPLGSLNGDGDIKSNASSLSTVRLFKIPNSVQPDDTLIWHASDSDDNFGRALNNFSGVLYYMGYKLHQELDVPIGLLQASKGGSAISVWMDTPDDPNTGQLFEKQVAPMVPYTIRGVAWYQGEKDALGARGLAYGPDMQTLIEGWRAAWGLPDMPFYYVQLAPYDGYTDGELPLLWEAQASALKIPNTGMAVISDTVIHLDDIHPRQKVAVGNRLALWALAKDYGQTDLVYSGPLFESALIEGNQIRILFAHAAGLKTSDGTPPNEFQIAGADGIFVDADAVIDGETVVVSAPSVPSPEVVQFGWHKTAQPNLRNGADLPASPFQTDNWQGGVDAFRPTTPTGLSAVPGDALVSLDWDDGFVSNLSYSVHRSTSPDLSAATRFDGLSASSYVDTSVTNGVTYYYAVTASDTDGNESTQSSSVFAIPADPANQAPAFTSDPVVEADGQERTAYSASLANDASDPENDPMIFSLLSGPSWLSVASDGTLSGTPQPGDIGPNSFTVQVDAAGGSDTAELQIEVDNIPDETPPAAPSGLSVSLGDNSVSLEWDDNSEIDLVDYSVYRSTTSGSYGTALAPSVNSSDYTDNTAENGTVYYYVVTAIDSSGNESGQSNEVSTDILTEFEFSTAIDQATFPTLPTLSASDLAHGIAAEYDGTIANWDPAVLTDGLDDPRSFAVTGQGSDTATIMRYKIDLGSLQNVGTVNSYSYAQGRDTAHQKFSLYGSTTHTTGTAAEFDETDPAWTLIASEDVSGLDRPARYSYGVSRISGINTEYRELLWVTERPYSFVHTVWKEFDVIAGETTPSTGYSLWASGNELFDNDANGDGVENGLAFLLGAADPDADATGQLPTVSGNDAGALVLTFDMLDSASRGTATLYVEHSSDLGVTDPWTPVAVPDSNGGPTGDVTFEVSGSETLNVTATIGAGEAADGKLFGRVTASE